MSAVTRDSALRGLIAGAATKLAKRREAITTVGQFVDFLPRRYIETNASGRLAEFAEGETAVLVATVVSARTRPMRQRRGRMLEATIQDADGSTASLVFFSAWGHDGRLIPGVTALFRGTLKTYRGGLQLAHPDYTFTDEDHDTVYEGGLVPLYPSVEGLTDMQISQSMKLVLDAWDEPDPVPPEIVHGRGLVSEREAYRLIHFPRDQRQAGKGRRRLRYDEALVVQTQLAARRAAYQSELSTPRAPRPGGLLDAFDDRLPFELTDGQRQVSEQIAADLAAEHPMHRLLQGEVGSGKTVVAIRAMLAAIDGGAQAALLAPTEVLAAQHDRSIRAMLGPLAEGGLLGGAEHGTRVALLTGGMSKTARERSLLDIASGEAGIVIGTHALIQDPVQFADLGLVVVDEQHRFGVEQRDALRGKASRPPHVLVMTATPIPRTVAMTVFGDMEVSELRQLPAGRAPIQTHVVPAAKPGWLERTWVRVAEEVTAGHQAYVVCPRIGDEMDALLEVGSDEAPPEQETYDDTPASGEAAKPVEMHGVHQMLERLRGEPALTGVRLELLHGRMSAEDKEAVMVAFGRGEIDVLVSTTVIEVGVDVPNATVMVIMDADRFGISQLHQLRGRVGRGAGGGLCLLVTGTENPATLERLEAVAATTDGFGLADLDLSLRREGDILGAQQSGRRSGLRLLRLTHPADVTLIQDAREDATALIAADPTLSEHPALAQWVQARLGDEQAAFLERG